ncbi:MAG TPA: hypothetical protein VLA53_03220 [Nitrosopumilaceae archaeon]|nr:hypothetical protein [Nitrosopumilaceae archaeon]
MLKGIGFGLIFLAFIMILPATNSNTQSDLPKMYGIATIVLKDSTGNILFENMIHNQVVDVGTTYMLDQAFGDGGTDVSDANQVDTMCVTDFAAPDGATNDAETTADFNTENGLTGNNCKGNIVFTTAATTAGSGTQTFSAGTHFPAGTVVGGIGICGNGAQGAGPFNDCDTTANQAPLLAVVDTTNVTVNSGESVDITYTLTLD